MTDFERIFSAFKETGLKMIVAKDKSLIILEENVEDGSQERWGKEYNYVEGLKEADGYCGFYCKFYFDENGNSEGFGVWE